MDITRRDPDTLLTRKVTAHIPESVWIAIVEDAKTSGITISELVRTILEDIYELE